MHRTVSLLAVACALLPGAAALAQAQDVVRALPSVQVIHSIPLPGFDVPATQFPANAQQADDAQIERAGASSLTDFLQRRFAGVSAAQVQGNAFQPDLTYRGQRLSPLLGTAQGLSVWLDGVRMNQALADVVSWELLPEPALAEVALVPGSNGLYGLNTIGGALVLATKSGLTHPGTEAEASLGSAGRLRVDAARGWRGDDGWHAYLSASRWQDRGWRQRARSGLGTVFLKAGRQKGEDGWSASLLAAGSHLGGNGLLNDSLLAIDRTAYYTGPDTTSNRDALATLRGTWGVDGLRLTALSWTRTGRRDGLTGDVDPDFISVEPLAAVINRSTSRQQDSGAALQATRTAAGGIQLAFGVDAGAQRVRYAQTTQRALFDGARIAQPGAQAEDLAATLDGRVARIGGFIAVDRSWHAGARLSASLRWDRTQTRNTLGPDLSVPASFSYRTTNPSLGIRQALGESTSLFASASQGARVPTSIELGCADPARPCVLPTGLQSDPSLRPVIARTLESGLRGTGALRWSAAVFRTLARDDIMFVRSNAAQAGYFTNVGRTLRQGLEVQAGYRTAAFEWQASLTWLRATYQAALVFPGPLSTPAQPNAVSPGTPVAGLPRATAKLGLDWNAAPGWRLGLDGQVVGSQAIAGNEGGTRPELGHLPGYGVLNVGLRWQATQRVQAFLRITNVLDRRITAFAGGNVDVFPAGRPLQAGDLPSPARFVAPGAPRLFVAGLRYEWGP